MSAVSRLIDVKYTDLTNYVDEPGDDILGLPLCHHWGPADKLGVFNRTQFFQAYPDSEPLNNYAVVEVDSEDTLVKRSGVESLGLTTEDYNSYAQVKKAFELGIQAVEVIRPSQIVAGSNVWKTSTVTLTGVTSPDTYNIAPTWLNDLSELTGVSIVGKYPGIPSKPQGSEYDTLLVHK